MTSSAADEGRTRAAYVEEVAPTAFDWRATPGPAADLRAVLAAAESHDGAAPLDEAALLTLRHQGLTGSRLWLAPGAAGFAWLRPGADSSALDLAVDPAHRRTGVGTALLAAALAAADGGADGAADSAVEAWSHGNHPAAAVLAERNGFAQVRDLWVMRRPSSAPLPDLEVPDELVLRTFRPGEDEEAFLALNAEAFADHPEQGRMTRADLDHRMAEEWFDPAGFFVAERRDEPGRLVGFHWTKVADRGSGDGPAGPGEVYVVGVSPRAQGAGLGRVLTLAGLHHLVAVGVPEILLYVEADNTPAVRVYSRLGFEHADADTHVQYRRGPRT